MKMIEVVAAVILKEGKILATQRGYGDFKDKWEFPGGKIENGETRENALTREILEELDLSIAVKNLVGTVEHDYPAFHLTMHCFICDIQSGALVLKEHKSAKWLNKSELDEIDWLPADVIAVDLIKDYLD